MPNIKAAAMERNDLAKSAEAINLSAGRMSPSIETPMLVNS
jgi:hypothetical protein